MGACVTAPHSSSVAEGTRVGPPRHATTRALSCRRRQAIGAGTNLEVDVCSSTATAFPFSSGGK